MKLTEEQRSENTKRAGAKLVELTNDVYAVAGDDLEYAGNLLMHGVTSLFASYFGTLYQNGVSANLLMSGYDEVTGMIRETLVEVCAGEKAVKIMDRQGNVEGVSP